MSSKIYLDANVILDLLLSGRESSKHTSEIIRNYSKETDTIFVTNNLNFNTIFYVGTEHYKQYENTKEFLKYIHNDKEQWEIYNLTDRNRDFAFDYMDKNFGADFEDLLQYISAKTSGCSLIITNDINFPKLDIELKRTNPNIQDYKPKSQKRLL